MIDLVNIIKDYAAGDGYVRALNDVTLHIKSGEIFGIIGLSGAGKSSLIRCINRLEEPTSGKILVGGVDVTALQGKELREMRKRIGMIFQHFNLLMNSTVYENIAFPLRISKVPEEKIRKRVMELLDVVDLQDKRDVYPAQLSGGQKQRVGIARALANNPDIILSDEATSALDPSTTESILNLLKDINKKLGITIVVITHEMDVIKQFCHRVAVMENGVIIEEGNVLDIFSNPKTQVSKRFLKDTIAKLPEGILLQDDNHEEEVLRISFLGEDAEKPHISHMVKEFNVDANIISGSIETIQGVQVGNLIIKLTGTREKIKGCLGYLNESNLKVEVLKNGNI